MPRTKIVYDGGRLEHMTSAELYNYVSVLDKRNRDPLNRFKFWEINDRAAQTIAAMWHSPANPNSTLLSTMGKVSENMVLGDFCEEYEYRSVGEFDRLCLDYLDSYITSKQERQ